MLTLAPVARLGYTRMVRLLHVSPPHLGDHAAFREPLDDQVIGLIKKRRSAVQLVGQGAQHYDIDEVGFDRVYR